MNGLTDTILQMMDTTPEQLKNPEDVPHARIYGRLLEMCTPVRFAGDDFRRAAAQQKKERLIEKKTEKHISRNAAHFLNKGQTGS